MLRALGNTEKQRQSEGCQPECLNTPSFAPVHSASQLLYSDYCVESLYFVNTFTVRAGVTVLSNISFSNVILFILP